MMKRFLIAAAILLPTAALVYLATIGCCHLLASGRKPASLLSHLALSAEQKKELAGLEAGYLAEKQRACERLCATRDRLLTALQKPDSDQVMLTQMIEEIGREQMNLEKATLQHILAVRGRLDSRQKVQLTRMVSERLHSACEMTACGATPACAVTGKKD
ncbi:MAG: periplasmic heavy metal sensor [Candidatus Omnitrophica bacterium]|nr:periplasmic heavy metal sensor [Candidatus Omnitrophota bacterium]